MTTPPKYIFARLNPEYVDYLEGEVRKLNKIRQTLRDLDDEDVNAPYALWDRLTIILDILP